MLLPNHKNCNLAIIGLGYVGLPLAVEFAKFYERENINQKPSRKVIGFDINLERISQLKEGLDITKEICKNDLKNVQNITFTADESELIYSDVFIITVPTPVNKNKQPDLSPLIEASKTVGKALKNRNLCVEKNINKTLPIIIYESTVYPGATEEICIPVLENFSNLKLNEIDPLKGFIAGYSPERINPGDKEHSLKSIIKITSGSNKEGTEWIDRFYSNIISAGTFPVRCIKIAEAAKVIENTQRDLNIALINELAIIFEKMNLNTAEVLEAANTKWNFLNFNPGLVGGHCIGVDPYYLTQKSIELGYIPELVLAGRKINDGMSGWIANLLIKNMAQRSIPIVNSNVLIMGYTFKEDCNDTRNTQVKELIRILNEFNLNIYLNDPYIKDLDENFNNLKVQLINNLDYENKFDAIVVCLAHKEYKLIKRDEWLKFCKKNSLIIDLKNFLPKNLPTIKI